MKEFEPGHGFSKEDWDEVSDNPEWTEEDFKLARPFREVFGDVKIEILGSRGRPPVKNPKRQITLRLDADIVEKYKSSGKGWQSRLNADLRKAAGL